MRILLPPIYRDIRCRNIADWFTPRFSALMNRQKVHTMQIKHLLPSLLLPTVLCAFAAPFTVSADGQEMTDTNTGLIWRRCAEGMTTSGGICMGMASTFTHEAALTRASAQAASSSLAWRLPNVKELSSIADKSRRNPAIDVATFPTTQANYFWSSSPYVGNAGYAWLVDFYDGFVKNNDRYNTNYVRLVRAGQ